MIKPQTVELYAEYRNATTKGICDFFAKIMTQTESATYLKPLVKLAMDFYLEWYSNDTIRNSIASQVSRDGKNSSLKGALIVNPPTQAQYVRIMYDTDAYLVITSYGIDGRFSADYIFSQHADQMSKLLTSLGTDQTSKTCTVKFVKPLTQHLGTRPRVHIEFSSLAELLNVLKGLTGR